MNVCAGNIRTSKVEGCIYCPHPLLQTGQSCTPGPLNEVRGLTVSERCPHRDAIVLRHQHGIHSHGRITPGWIPLRVRRHFNAIDESRYQKMSQKIQTISLNKKVANIRILCVEAIAVVVRIMLNLHCNQSTKIERQLWYCHTYNIYTGIDWDQQLITVAEIPAFWHQFSLSTLRWINRNQLQQILGRP